jgi:hypothetical protein
MNSEPGLSANLPPAEVILFLIAGVNFKRTSANLGWFNLTPLVLLVKLIAAPAIASFKYGTSA